MSLPEPAGAKLETWVQSQTTYATLSRRDDGSWGVTPVKQKIWVDGVSYELQEIFGIENCGASGMPGAEAGDDGKECVVCLSEPRDTTVLPCRHMCMCSECARIASPPEQQVPHLPHGGGVAAGDQGGDQGGGRRERVAGIIPLYSEFHECMRVVGFRVSGATAASRAVQFFRCDFLIITKWAPGRDESSLS